MCASLSLSSSSKVCLTLPVAGVDAPLDIWSFAEPCIGIYCACLPVLGLLFRQFFKEHLNTGARSRTSRNRDSLKWPSQGGTTKSETGTGAGFSKLDASAEPREVFKPFNPHAGGHKSEVIAGNRPSDVEEQPIQMNGIQVRSDVEWSSTNTR